MTDQNVQNILDIYCQATVKERHQGKYWYPNANTFARGLSTKYKVDIDAVAGIIAVLSPRLSWPKNMAYAESLFKTGYAPVLGSNLKKARDILNGATLPEIQNGPKVRAFYETILAPRNNSYVVVDRHAYSVWQGKVVGEKDLRFSPATYRKISDDYVAAAKLTTTVTSAVQAITWVVWKRLKKEGKV